MPNYINRALTQPKLLHSANPFPESFLLLLSSLPFAAPLKAFEYLLDREAELTGEPKLLIGQELQEMNEIYRKIALLAMQEKQLEQRMIALTALAKTSLSDRT